MINKIQKENLKNKLEKVTEAEETVNKHIKKRDKLYGEIMELFNEAIDGTDTFLEFNHEVWEINVKKADYNLIELLLELGLKFEVTQEDSYITFKLWNQKTEGGEKGYSWNRGNIQRNKERFQNNGNQPIQNERDGLKWQYRTI